MQSEQQTRRLKPLFISLLILLAYGLMLDCESCSVSVPERHVVCIYLRYCASTPPSI